MEHEYELIFRGSFDFFLSINAVFCVFATKLQTGADVSKNSTSCYPTSNVKQKQKNLQMNVLVKEMIQQTSKVLP